jgi:hypothetical protein
MPAHDWTRVTTGTFHSFHLGWIGELTRSLNATLLPDNYYALAEQRAAEFEPDLLALERLEPDSDDAPHKFHGNGSGGTALATAEPKAHIIGEVDEASLYAIKRRTVAIRHATDDRIVALVEIASPGNKDRAQSVQRFVDKAVAALQSGYHLVVIDLFEPGKNDPAGLASAVWEEVGGRRIAWPPGNPLSGASFRVADRVRCYAESFAAGTVIPELPLF